MLDSRLSEAERLLHLYLLKRKMRFQELLTAKLSSLLGAVVGDGGIEVRLLTEDVIFGLLEGEVRGLLQQLRDTADNKITQASLHGEVRTAALFFIDIMNRTKATEYYSRYSHTLIQCVEVMFRRQNSSLNEMIQHGITIHKGLVIDPVPGEALGWVSRLMTKCGVIGWEQTVQSHTHIATDSKLRVYPFHKADRSENAPTARDYSEPHEYIKSMDIKPSSSFFGRRMRKFVDNMDENDYRCKIAKHGLIKVLYVFQKSYSKYLADLYRLIQADEVSADDVRTFTPDVILFYGAPEKVISFPQIGYFDLPGPHGNIKTLVAPLKKEVDYFGNIKKPWLAMLNEKVKEMGGVPVHGSLFMVEEEDGSLFVVQIAGDSGVGKSEMLAAMILKWLRKDLPGIRSIKLIAGDMYFIFPMIKGTSTESAPRKATSRGSPITIRISSGTTTRFSQRRPTATLRISIPAARSAACAISRCLSRSTSCSQPAISPGLKRVLRAIRIPRTSCCTAISHGERKEKATSSDNPHLHARFCATPATRTSWR